MSPADAIVVGAGAAGLMAAIVAARRGKRVRLLEKNARPGLKILISGGGRCNLTTTRRGADLERQYGERRGRWLRHALRAFPPDALVAMVEAAGVPLREEDLEKVFPVAGRARDVLGAFLGMAEKAGVELVTDAPMRAVARSGDGFAVTTPLGEERCRSLVLASGGLSYPKTGATGDGYPVCQAFGHSVVPTVPALAPLRIDLPWLHELQGIVVDAGIRALDRADNELARRQRPILFTHRGLSGPAPMDLSGFVEEAGGGCRIELDLVPDQRRENVRDALLAVAWTSPRRAVYSALPTRLPERLRQALCRRAGAETTLAELTKATRNRLVDLVKSLSLPCDASLGFAHAEVTRGGIPLDEVDARTMQSKLCPGLYIVGELLDVDGPIGGFNFQAAFATGRLAGLAV